MKLSSLASAIGFAELTYQVRQNVPELTTLAGQLNNRGQIYPGAVFVFTGAVYYLLCFSLELLTKRWQKSRCQWV